MTYLSETTEPLIKALRHQRGLPVHQLAGHAANLDFWMGEVAQRVMAIDGYRGRFERMRASQREFETAQASAAGFKTSSAPLARSSTDSQRKELRRELVDAAHALLNRLQDEELVDMMMLKRYRDALAA